MTLASTAALAGGSRMPLLGLGTWQLRGSAAREAVGWALEAGYRHLDTATAYGNEAEIGLALTESGVPRDEVFVTTKLPPDNVGRERATLEESLSALRTDHVDLWLIHWPPGGSPGVPSWQELLRAREDGLARAVGVSNYSPDQLDALAQATGVTPEVNQVPWSPVRHDPELLAAHRQRGVVLEGYSPFRRLSLDDPVLTGVAEAHGVGTAQVVVRWHLQHGIVVIPKSANRERIVANADVEGFELSDEQMRQLDAMS